MTARKLFAVASPPRAEIRVERVESLRPPVAAQQPRDALHLRRQVGGERVEGVVVERQGDAAVAELGQDDEGVLQAVVGEAVGVVAKEHAVHCMGGLVARLKGFHRAAGSLGPSVALSVVRPGAGSRKNLRLWA